MKDKFKKHFTASAIIIDKGKVLLVDHKKPGAWICPGGHVEDNEAPYQTIIREVKEETGLNVEIICEKDESLSDHDVDVSALYVPYAILCELIGGDHYHNDMIYLCKIIDKDYKQMKHDPKESNGGRFFRNRRFREYKAISKF